MPAIPLEATCPTLAAIYQSYERRQDDGLREHLGASVIGRPCERELWYMFRWAAFQKFEGRVLRLFETGKLEETRLVRDLRAAGIEIQDADPETGEQFRVQTLGGHFGGSMDAAGTGFQEAPATWHVIEFKTHNLKSFATLQGEGVQRAKPEHWAQMQVYMLLSGMDRAAYLAVCKDNDELYMERVYADKKAAQALIDKACRVIESPQPLSRLSEDPAWWQCWFCGMRPVCHMGAPGLANCRTCIHSTPDTEQGGWRCERQDLYLSYEMQLDGCPEHVYIPDLLPVKYKDATDTGITYDFAGHTILNGPGGVPSGDLRNMLTRAWPWLRDNMAALLAAGFTGEKLFGYPLLSKPYGHGVGWLDLWGRNEVRVSLDEQGIRFAWTDIRGGEVVQHAAP